MAQSPAHKFGQLIGNLLEELVAPLLREFAESHGLFLDHQGKPRAARRGKKVSWRDAYGNLHDLDYVLERNGTNEVLGTPVAFIEVAWRRYTKHARNKAQEIQGAILPLREKFERSTPILGAVSAGEFTEGSIEQLRSHGFQVLYFHYELIVAAFASEGIDIAFDERTSDATFRRCVKEIERVSDSSRKSIKSHLKAACHGEITDFMTALAKRFERMIDKVIVVPLYGRSNEFTTVEEALSFLDSHSVYEGCGDFRKYEVVVQFSNGDRVEGSFRNQVKVKEFLHFISVQ